MDPTTEMFVALSFFFFSLLDTRYRTVPAIEVFFIGTLFLAVWTHPLVVIAVVLAFTWGRVRAAPGYIVLPLLFVPTTWGVLLAGYGVRKDVVGRSDLVAVAGLACLYPWQALVMCFIGIELFRRLWRRRWPGPVPALPGMLLGLAVYIVLRPMVV